MFSYGSRHYFLCYSTVIVYSYELKRNDSKFNIHLKETHALNLLSVATCFWHNYERAKMANQGVIYFWTNAQIFRTPTSQHRPLNLSITDTFRFVT